VDTEEKIQKLEQLVTVLTECMSMSANVIAAQHAIMQAMLAFLQERGSISSDEARERALGIAEGFAERKAEIAAAVEKMMTGAGSLEDLALTRNLK